MKTRSGFVSNSSSSSFVVAFPHRPKDLGDIISMMFPGAMTDGHVTSYDEVMHVGDVCGRVLKDIGDKKSLDEEEMTETFKLLSFDLPRQMENVFHVSGLPDNLNKYLEPEEMSRLIKSDQESHFAWMETYAMKDGDKEKEKKREIASELSNMHWKLSEKLTEVCAKRRTKDFMSANKKKFFAAFSYSDNEGDQVMEHGDIFKNLNHVTINQH